MLRFSAQGMRGCMTSISNALNARYGNSGRASAVVKPKVSQRASVVYHGNVSSHAYHSPGCRHYDCKNCTEVFPSKGEAEKSGYRAHGECVE